MPDEIVFRVKTEKPDALVDDSLYISVTNEQLIQPHIVVKTSSADVDLVSSDMEFLRVRNVPLKDEYVTYTLGSASSEKRKEVKRANNILSEGVEIDFDLAY